MFPNITLEMSLKPFRKTDDEYIQKVCTRVFEDWKPLVRDAETVSVLLWTADGSEILEYKGNLQEEFEWCKYIGNANPKSSYHCEGDPDKIGLHAKTYLYMEQPPVMTYETLQKIIAALKKAGQEVLGGKKIRVGETFDPGPEFAKSSFKYEKHPEICAEFDYKSQNDLSFVCAYHTLHADDTPYASGKIMEGMPFAAFFGKQCNIFLKDMGFDYLWLSNGFGFGSEPWDSVGAIYDGKDFHTEKFDEIREKVLSFWTLFRKECPDFPIETRGTNLSAGIDYAKDGVPLKSIYDGGFGLLPPPNSPWAALNQDFGLEIMGYLSRIAELPEDSYLFRYYIHDPWWVNSPWYDRYEGQPHDIYLPMAVARIDQSGQVQKPTHLNLLSIDNSFGEMPQSCVTEPIPHLLKAYKDAPDAPAPLVWLYPFDEYMESRGETALRQMYEGDWFVRDIINDAVPVSMVVSTTSFIRQTDWSVYQDSILVTPVPEQGSHFEKAVIRFAMEGGRVIFYGEGENAAYELLRKEKKITAWVQKSTQFREVLEQFDLKIRLQKTAEDRKSPVLMVNRSDNGFFFSVCNHDTTVGLSLQFPWGAPLLLGYETDLKDGFSTYHLPRCEHRECRVFVEQKEGHISCWEETPVSYFYRRRILIEGLKDATVRVFPENYCIGNTDCLLNSPWPSILSDEYEGEWHENYFEMRNITGQVLVSMPRRDIEK